jgi:hypothetical protein
MSNAASPACSELKAWLDGFDAVHAADAEAARRDPIDSSTAVRLALALMTAMWAANGGRLPVDPLRDREVAAVRATWARLRAGWDR